MNETQPVQMDISSQLSDSSVIQGLVNTIIMEAAIDNGNYKKQLDLIDSLQLALTDKIQISIDKEISNMRNMIAELLLKKNSIESMNYRNDKKLFIEYKDIEIKLCSNLVQLNKLCIKVARDVINNPYTGPLRF